VAAATGDGPVDATYKAINEIVKADLILIDYQIKSVTKGEGAQGEVTIRTKKGDVELTARGISTDIIEASAKAYLNALGKFENMKGKK
jgi:2-isopropylmalate synthase